VNKGGGGGGGSATTVSGRLRPSSGGIGGSGICILYYNPSPSISLQGNGTVISVDNSEEITLAKTQYPEPVTATFQSYGVVTITIVGGGGSGGNSLYETSIYDDIYYGKHFLISGAGGGGGAACKFNLSVAPNSSITCNIGGPGEPSYITTTGSNGSIETIVTCGAGKDGRSVYQNTDSWGGEGGICTFNNKMTIDWIEKSILTHLKYILTNII
jgi:hypothetical protein